MTKRSAAERIKYRKANAVDPEQFLRSADAVTDEDGDLTLTTSFKDEVKAQLIAVEDLGVDIHHVADIFNAPVESVSPVEREGPAYKVYNTIHNWPAEAAILIDVALDRALRERAESWDDVPGKQCFQILQSLRVFQDDCLFCDGPVEIGDPEARELPVGDGDVVPVRCRDCDRLFVEFLPGSVPTK